MKYANAICTLVCICFAAYYINDVKYSYAFPYILAAFVNIVAVVMAIRFEKKYENQ